MSWTLIVEMANSSCHFIYFPLRSYTILKFVEKERERGGEKEKVCRSVVSDENLLLKVKNFNFNVPCTVERGTRSPVRSLPRIWYTISLLNGIFISACFGVSKPCVNVRGTGKTWLQAVPSMERFQPNIYNGSMLNFWCVCVCVSQLFVMFLPRLMAPYLVCIALHYRTFGRNCGARQSSFTVLISQLNCMIG